MSARVLLHLLIELGKNLINSIIQEHECYILFIIWRYGHFEDPFQA